MLVPQAATSAVQNIYRRDNDVIVWWATEIECVSAIARLERRRNLTARGTIAAMERLDAFKRSWNEVQPLETVRDTARRVLRTHDLRAADALQLGAALVASEGRPASLEFLSLDGRLVDAAQREGLLVNETFER
jgi:uncharacterized protein